MNDAEKLVKLDSLISMQKDLKRQLAFSSRSNKETLEDKIEELEVLIDVGKKDIVADSCFWTMAGLEFRNYCEHYRWT